MKEKVIVRQYKGLVIKKYEEPVKRHWFHKACDIVFDFISSKVEDYVDFKRVLFFAIFVFFIFIIVNS